jgi:E3 ubiquitin-protein ligase HUWE1
VIDTDDWIGQDERVANQMFRGLVTLNIRSTLLSDIFSNVSYSHGRVTTLLLDILLGSSSGGVVPELGTLHRLGIWEDIALKAGLAYKGLDTPHSTPRTPFLPPNDLPPSDSSHQRSDSRPIPSAENTTQQGHELVKEKESVREQNVRALKHLAHALPASLSPFFLGSIQMVNIYSIDILSAIIKMFTTRRTPDASQRKQIMLSAKIIADIVLQHVTHVDIRRYSICVHIYVTQDFS